MPNTKNQNQAQELQNALKESKAIILANYAGLGVSSQNELRRLVAQTGAKFSIAKNTLLRLALKDKLGDLPENVLQALEGPTAVLWMSEDPIAPTKALVKFATDNELPQIKLGLLDGQILSQQDVINLAKLPDKQQLYAMLAGQLNAPISSFAQVLRANIQSLVFVVDAVRRSKEA